MPNSRYDVAIIGAGITGSAIARYLSRYDLKLILIDSEADVAMGSSRANSAIVHAGFDCAPGTLMAEMNVKGNALYDSWCEELDVPLKRIGSVVIGFGEADEAELQKLYDKGIANGVPGVKLISGDEVRAIEPSISADVTKALWAPTGAITCPYELTIACAENARENGCEWLLNAPVSSITTGENGVTIAAGDRTVEAKFVINAAGLFADRGVFIFCVDGISLCGIDLRLLDVFRRIADLDFAQGALIGGIRTDREHKTALRNGCVSGRCLTRRVDRHDLAILIDGNLQAPNITAGGICIPPVIKQKSYLLCRARGIFVPNLDDRIAKTNVTFRQIRRHVFSAIRDARTDSNLLLGLYADKTHDVAVLRDLHAMPHRRNHSIDYSIIGVVLICRINLCAIGRKQIDTVRIGTDIHAYNLQTLFADRNHHSLLLRFARFGTALLLLRVVRNARRLRGICTGCKQDRQSKQQCQQSSFHSRIRSFRKSLSPPLYPLLLVLSIKKAPDSLGQSAHGKKIYRKQLFSVWLCFYFPLINRDKGL
ncbi:MAG: FAD-dependent oxidoreductase [Loktanella sp.]|nr:FAD-dependent oxidoreductase [Loktanella sp.]